MRSCASSENGAVPSVAVDGMSSMATCPSCGLFSPGEFHYCGHCGRPLDNGRPPAASDLPAYTSPRERRQLTILFSDLAGSTALSAGMDAEDFGELISAYFELCDAAFKRFGAFVDREEGDSLRVYFGYPEARDDDAPRAVRAALEVMAAVEQLGTKLGRPLAVHIGIHTGEVVAGASSEPADKKAPLIVGQAPNIARRLQELAPPTCLYVSATTWRLVERQFNAAALGPRHLKGLPQSTEVFQILGPRGSSSTIDQFDTRSLAPLVGRDAELATLAQHWARACDGHGCVALVSGDPGIGKSRLVHSFLTQLGPGIRRILVAQCQEQFANSALYPLIELLRVDFGLERETVFNEATFAKTRIASKNSALSPDALPLVGSLLALPVPSPALADSLKAQRERSLEWLARWVLGDPHRPLVLVLEDLHWADASTLDFLDMLLPRLEGRRSFLLLTHRNDFKATWQHMPSHAGHLSLSKIAPLQARSIAQNIAGSAHVPEELLNAITARSDGVPLYVEELTKMILDAHEGDRWLASREGQDSVAAYIPETLRGSLAARLDYLGASKAVAQIASVLGREFSYSLVLQISGMPEARLQGALGELVRAELLFQRGEIPAASFVFKHVLLQEAAYLSLLKARRADYHSRTAQVLVERFPDLIERHPELAAHHFAAAGNPGQAFEFWHRAGQHALQASADVEAAAHLRLALGQLGLAHGSSDTVGREVACLVALGSALTATRGYAATEVEEAFAKAHELCQSLGDVEQLYAALMGLHTFYQVRGSLLMAVRLGEQLVAIAEQQGNRLWLAQSHRCLGWSLFCNGRLAEGAEHLSAALALFDRMQSHDHLRTQGAHPWVVGFVNMALLKWFAGEQDTALELSREAIALAREVQTPLPLAYALCMSAKVRCLRHEPQEALALASEAIELAVKHGMPYWSSWGSTIQGWALVHLGQPTVGLETLHEGLNAYSATGARLFVPSSLALLAESYATAGDTTRALEVVQKAMADPSLVDGYFYKDELQRIHESLRQAERLNVSAHQLTNAALEAGSTLSTVPGLTEAAGAGAAGADRAADCSTGHDSAAPISTR